MKLIHIEKLIDAGQFSSSPVWKTIERELRAAIDAVRWPPGSKKFVLYDEPGKARRAGNGVKPIKEQFVKTLRDEFGWGLETRVDIATVAVPGAFDATRQARDKLFAVEWETGNISSSHRAINKMALGILQGRLIGGALVLPTRQMYYYLTDRVGNYRELEPYFPLWKAVPCEEGLLSVIAVEHDAVSKKVPRIPKGTAGRALE